MLENTQNRWSITTSLYTSWFVPYSFLYSNKINPQNAKLVIKLKTKKHNLR